MAVKWHLTVGVTGYIISTRTCPICCSTDISIVTPLTILEFLAVGLVGMVIAVSVVVWVINTTSVFLVSTLFVVLAPDTIVSFRTIGFGGQLMAIHILIAAIQRTLAWTTLVGIPARFLVGTPNARIIVGRSTIGLIRQLIAQKYIGLVVTIVNVFSGATFFGDPARNFVVAVTITAAPRTFFFGFTIPLQRYLIASIGGIIGRHLLLTTTPLFLRFTRGGFVTPQAIFRRGAILPTVETCTRFAKDIVHGTRIHIRGKNDTCCRRLAPGTICFLGWFGGVGVVATVIYWRIFTVLLGLPGFARPLGFYN